MIVLYKTNYVCCVMIYRSDLSWHNSPWAKSRYFTCQYHQRGPHFNGTNLFRYIYSKYFFLLDIPNW